MARNNTITDLIARSGGIDHETAERIRLALRDGGHLRKPAPAPAAAPRVPLAAEDTCLIEATLERSVAGYCAPGPDMTLKGTVREVANAVDKACAAFYAKVEAAFQRHGDHRAFCPELGNGYPSRSPDFGDVVKFSVLAVKVFQNGRVVEVPHGSRLYRFLDAVANDEYSARIDEAIDAFLGAGGAAEESASGPRP